MCSYPSASGALYPDQVRELGIEEEICASGIHHRRGRLLTHGNM